jgi:hypothetical protein
MVTLTKAYYALSDAIRRRWTPERPLLRQKEVLAGVAAGREKPVPRFMCLDWNPFNVFLHAYYTIGGIMAFRRLSSLVNVYPC